MSKDLKHTGHTLLTLYIQNNVTVVMDFCGIVWWALEVQISLD